ncbi:MAG: 4-hydroxy-tetrahydrodipicolinate synthase [Micrococcus sp.]|nr:4-hydroxy-tetrahydrodipicolinate synthase [Micrococcus sp.]
MTDTPGHASTAPSAAPRFGTMVPAMVTPMHADGQVDYDAAQALATHLVDQGADGLVVTGTTGETSTLRDEENLAMFRAVVEAVGDRAAVIAGTGTNDTAHSVHLSQEAKKTGVDGLLLVTPYYNKPNQAGIAAHFRTIAEAADLPVMVYDIPGRSVMPIHAPTLVELAEHELIVALKDAKGDLQSTTTVLADTDLDVYSGDDGATWPLMAMGAVGVVSVAAHVAPGLYRELVDAANAGDMARARAAHFALDPVQRGIMSHIQGAVAAKAVLAGQGLIPTAAVRLPLTEATPEELTDIRADLDEAGIAF